MRTLTVLMVAALAAARVEPQSSGVSARLRGISAVSSSVAWATGAGGTILRTVDGGRTWTAVESDGFDAIGVAPKGTAAYASGSRPDCTT